MEMMRGIYHAAEKLDINLLYFLGIHSRYYYRSYFGEDAEDDYDYQFNIVYDYAWLGKVDALIISYGSLSIFLEEREKDTFLDRFEGIPYVIMEEPDKKQKGTSIIADNYQGMYQIAEHLARDHGYRDFTYLAGPKGNTDAEMRKAAFLAVMKKYEIPFDESRVEYGDYSACVESQVNSLLDRFPDMEAMVCANDVMADTVYRECALRGIVVGCDICVTGYDDWEVSESMNPPLTTVVQNAYDMGYMAVSSAIDLCAGKGPQTIVVPALAKFRASCGCSDRKREDLSLYSSDLSWENSRKKAAAMLLERTLLANSNAAIKNAVMAGIDRLLEKDFREPDNAEYILQQIKRILEGDFGRYISPHSFLMALNAYTSTWINHLMMQEDRNSAVVLLVLKDRIQNLIMAHMTKDSNDRYMAYRQETWFLPLISRDMMNHIEDESEFYRGALMKLFALKAKRSYLFVFQEPVVHRIDDEWIRPELMYLATWHEGSHVYAPKAEERPVLSMQKGISDFCAGESPFSMCVFCLFSGEVQYGILVTEIDPSNLAMSYLISMQIGNTLKFYEISSKQKRMHSELEKLVKEVKEKNEVLNFISEYDSLTSCLNRRGFMERAVRLNRDNAGKGAVLIFADLDHLKEINDCYGHKEGDAAICQAAAAMRESVGGNGIVARIGGDEFIVMTLCGGDNRAEDIVARVKLANCRFNETAGKDYYVDVSMGYRKFFCGDQVMISEMLEDADRALYESKKSRRKSIRKT